MNPRIYTVATTVLNLQREWTIRDSILTTLPETLRQNFERFDEFPLYRFNFQGAYKHQLIQEYYPREYEILKEAIHLGRWVPSGSQWEVSEMRIPSDEAIIRNFNYGRQFYLSEYNRSCEDAFLVKQENLPEHLPSLLSHVNIKALTLFEKRSEISDEVGFKLGRWTSPWGKSVYLGVAKDMNDTHLTSSLSAQESLKEVDQHLLVYGHDEGGGAPDSRDISVVQEDVAKGSDFSTGITVISAKSDEFYRPLESKDTPKYVGDVGSSDCDGGLLTRRHQLKSYNRQVESLLLDTERLASCASILEYSYPKVMLDDAWKRVLSHHGYYDIGGVLSDDAYLITLEDFQLSLNQASSELVSSLHHLAHYLDTSKSGAAVVVYNPFEREVEETVEIQVPAGSFEVRDASDALVPSQNLGEKLLFLAKVGPMGIRVYYLRPEKKQAPSAFEIDPDNRTYGSKTILMSLDESGDITSIFHKGMKREILEGTIRYQHMDLGKETRGIHQSILDSAVDIRGPATIEIQHEGALCLSIRAEKSYGDSRIITTYRIYHHTSRVDVKTTLHWYEKNSLIKCQFPLAVYANHAHFIRGLGTAKRSHEASCFETHAKGCADISNGSWGVSILCTQKSGWDQPDRHTLRLSMLYSPGYEDMGIKDIHYSIYAHSRGYANALLEMGKKKHPLRSFYTEHHPGMLGDHVSFLEVETPGICLKSFKMSDSTEHFFLRLQEMKGRDHAEVKINFLSRVLSMQEVDGAENLIPSKSMIKGNSIFFEMKAFETKAYLIKLKKTDLGEQPLISEPLDVILNTNFYSPEGSKKITPMIPLELAKETIRSQGVDFRFYPERIESAMKLSGQRVSCPEGYNEIHFLAGSLTGQETIEIELDGEKISLSIGGFYEGPGGWDIERKGYYTGVNTEAVAWVSTHLHSPEGNLIYQKGHMYHYVLRGRRVKFPDHPSVMIFAISVAKGYDVTQGDYFYEVKSREKTYDLHVLGGRGSGSYPAGRPIKALLASRGERGSYEPDLSTMPAQETFIEMKKGDQHEKNTTESRGDVLDSNGL